MAANEGDTLDDDQNLPTNFANIPLEALNPSARRYLSLYLNNEGTLNDDVGLVNNYEGLAEKVGFTYLEIKHFSRQKSPTEELLVEWTERPDLSPTIGVLWESVKYLGRTDILTDTWKLIKRDCESYLKTKAKFQPKDKPLQDETVTQSNPYPDIQEDRRITIDDVEQRDSQPTIYDAFVCYSPEDEDLAFVRTMIEKLEGEYGLKLFIPHRDDLPGDAKNSVTAKLIEQRCKRMIIVISPRFLKSASCDFQTKFAQSLSPGSRNKKLIPILIEQCEIPLILRFITICNYTKKDLIEWFWRRLANSLKAPIETGDTDFRDSHSLSSINLDTSVEIPGWSRSTSMSSSSQSSGPSSMMSSSSSSSLSARNSSSNSLSSDNSKTAATSPAESYDGGYIHPIGEREGKNSDYEKIKNIKRPEVHKRSSVSAPVSSQGGRPQLPPVPPERSKKKPLTKEHISYC